MASSRKKRSHCLLLAFPMCENGACQESLAAQFPQPAAFREFHFYFPSLEEISMLLSPWIIVATLGAPATEAAPDTPLSGELRAPVKIEAGGKPIDVEIGHAAP